MAAIETLLPSNSFRLLASHVVYKVQGLEGVPSLALENSAKEAGHGLLPNHVVEVLSRVAEDLWPDVQASDTLVVEPLKGAMTNKYMKDAGWLRTHGKFQIAARYVQGLEAAGSSRVYSCHWTRPGGEAAIPEDRSVLLRLYGDMGTIFFNREEEKRTFEHMSALGMGPKLLASFPSGRVEEYLHAETLSSRHLRDPATSARIAAKMSEFHRLDVPLGRRKPAVWDRLRKWHLKALELVTPQLAAALDLERLGREIGHLERILGKSDAEVVFCHNDLQYGNIMMDRHSGSLTFIDYEYSSYNAAAYDIANHFCEMAADYHTDTPHVLDFGKYPGHQERYRFVETYLRGYEGRHVSHGEVEALLEEVERHAVVNHVHWALWGIISAHGSDIDFDYLTYAEQRLQQYQTNKILVLGSDAQ